MRYNPALKSWPVRVGIAVFFLFTVSCGLQSDLYVNYSTDEATATGATGGGETGGSGGSETGGTGGGDEECTAAIESFTANIAPAITSSCATAACHLSVPVGGAALSADDSKANRALFLKYDTSADGSVLIEKIGGAGHGGGNQSGVLGDDKIKAWKETEAGC